jgi:hypothetical protein
MIKYLIIIFLEVVVTPGEGYNPYNPNNPSNYWIMKEIENIQILIYIIIGYLAITTFISMCIKESKEKKLKVEIKELKKLLQEIKDKDNTK